MMRAPTLTISDRLATRIPGLDGLRVLAVLTVIIDHQGLVRIGWAGVQFFFVLSGYLITEILWQSRNQPLKSYLKVFYGRRALRIFPLYFGVLFPLTLGAVLLKENSQLERAFPYLVTYTYNLWHMTQGFVETSILGHFWSLCVEEQFYLLWPFAIFYCPSRYIRTLLIALFLAGPFIRFGEVVFFQSWSGANPMVHRSVYAQTATYFDAFAIGGLMALFPLGGRRSVFFGVLIASLLTTYFTLTSELGLLDSSGLGPAYVLIWGYGLINLCAALMIDCLAFKKVAPTFFDCAAMRYLGRISYGLYVFHLPVQYVIDRALAAAALPVRMALQILLTVVLADLSYRFMERPFLNLKGRLFPKATSVP